MIAPNSIASRKTIVPEIATIRRIRRSSQEAVATAKRALQGCAPPKAGDPSGRKPATAVSCSRTKEMHRVGLAVVQFTRSTSAEATAGRESLQPSALRARCKRNLVAHSRPVKAIVNEIIAITDNSY
jgi:hypothetical protein